MGSAGAPALIGNRSCCLLPTRRVLGIRGRGEPRFTREDAMRPALGRLETVNKELWLILSLFGICLLLNFLIVSQRMVLSFYTLPTLFSAYLYGRRHATLTAFASVLLVTLMTSLDAVLFASTTIPVTAPPVGYLDITV